MPASHATISPTHSSISADRAKGLPMAVAIVLAIVGLVITSATAKAAVIASDNAGNAPYTLTQSFIGQDGGTGFGNWIAGGGSIGTAVIGSGGTGQVFGITAGASSSYEAQRPFDAALNQGETFSTLINFANPTANSDVSITLYAGGTDVADVVWNNNEWQWNDGSGGVSTGVSTSSFTMSFTRTGSVGYSFTLNSYTKTGNLTGSSASAAITLVGYAASDSTNLQISSLQAVPEPSTYGMLIAGGLAMGGAAMRRRRRLVRG